MQPEVDDSGLTQILRETRRIAVLGIKTEAHAAQAAFYVPQYMDAAGYEIVPVPVYYPDVQSILGRPVYRTLAAIPGAIDIVNVFRRPQDLPVHVADILGKRPRCVWLQLGIRNDDVATALRAAGIIVVQDRCLMVEHRRLLG
ncbi:CoA-binding protein [Solimonas terrae]|uniref:CoA-binding protein n=1 Tax=Solimonas terrae TaxID=1396819 RepID=A0A6M2BN25_9GAMM|nr:CoA-binding protein [Solimonas terrae]NGY03838.1 CoA-binding protein [Solimonas terrae]